MEDLPIAIETVKELTQPTNSGFVIVSDDRVWDLRGLRANHLPGGGIQVVGPAIMTRISRLIKRTPNANQYRYLLLTAAKEFSARSPEATDGVKLLRSETEAVSGTNVSLTSYELQLDVSRFELNKEFILEAQIKTTDAPWDRNNTWLGMRFTDPTPAASIRIIFPTSLPYKRPVFLKYPNDSTLLAPSTDGIVLDSGGDKELLWRVDHPEPKWTYRVQWDWE